MCGPVIDWLKSTWGAIVAAALALLAFMAVSKASRHQKVAEKWQQKADDQANSDTEDSVVKANQALSQAKLHEARAQETKAKAEERLSGIKDESIRDLVSGWTADSVRKRS